ncbi:MAG TPA: MFS transporter [Microbacteriaceae bacterium]|nr:MFS transporter [Microbacteriaceae bacterium]
MVTGFGLLSLAVDIVSDGGSSLAGPLLGQLGASALVVGIVTGVGEAIGLGFRLVSGPWADRTRRYWTFTVVGYSLTVICIPLLALAPFVGGAGLAVASILIIGDRTGKAVRSPAKTVLLASAAGAVGRGRGFAVHKALDQTGSLLGPIVVAGVIALTTVLWPAFAVLAIPGIAAIALLTVIRARVPDVGVYERDAAPLVASPGESDVVPRADAPVPRLPKTFYPFAAAAFAANAGLVTYGVISFHVTTAGLVPLSAVPLVYAAAMAAGALSALASGYVYDRWGTNVLLALPFLIALVPGLALSNQIVPVIVGVIAWGAASGIQESTVKAMVADLVPSPRRATAYGIFAAFEGAGALVGGVLSGALYGERGVLVLVVLVLQACALALLLVTVRRQRRHDRAAAE